MRMFVMVRDEDVTGVSGTGTVAEGVEFEDGTTVIRWLGNDLPRSTVVWESVAAASKVHGHDGRTRFVFDPTAPTCLRQHVED